MTAADDPGDRAGGASAAPDPGPSVDLAGGTPAGGASAAAPDGGPADDVRDVSAPRIVLDDDGLDRLELVLGGWLPSEALDPLLAGHPVTSGDDLPGGVPGGFTAVLADAENSPIAEVRSGPGGQRSVRPLRPPARGAGPHWDPSVRLTAAQARTAIAAGHPGASDAVGGVLALVIDDVPTRSDLDRLLAAARHDQVRVVIVVVPVARRGRPARAVGWPGLTRSAWAAAAAIEDARHGLPVVRLVLPAPTSGGVDIDAALGGAGVSMTGRVSGVRSARDRDRIGALAGLLEREVRDLYPPGPADEVLRAQRVAPERGAVVFFTGLSGSGKSTIARALAEVLADVGPRRVTLLDGDEVRHHLSRGLGFDRASRAANIDRIGWVASLISAHGGIAVAAPIAPFDADRRAARAMAEPHGPFLLVHVSTPLEVCEGRDRKGLYARARTGEIPEFTGISSPYEAPDDADVTIDTTAVGVDEAVRQVRTALLAALGPD
jgi:sulfate adenylyltransferase